MQPMYSIRKFLLKIGFVITLALSFNPVDALAEPVVITLPVVAETEWVMESLPLIDSQTKSKLFDEGNTPSDPFFDQASPIDFFFRLIHFERIVKVHLGQWTVKKAHQNFNFPYCTHNRLLCSGDDEDIIA